MTQTAQNSNVVTFVTARRGVRFADLGKRPCGSDLAARVELVYVSAIGYLGVRRVR